MRLATFSEGGSTRIGVVVGDEIVDLAAAAPSLPDDMTAFLTQGDAAMQAARDALEAGANRISLSSVTLHAAVPRPPKFLAVGLNYADHIAETGRKAPDFPTIFNKQVSCTNGPYADVHLPRASKSLDYEGELAFVIGKPGRHVPKERAHEIIAGYCIVNDVSVRDWQGWAPTMTLGKSWDTHGPVGPWIVTADEVDDPHALSIKTTVNGELRQDSNTKHLMLNCYEAVELLSTVFTLQPGDIVATGTPSGVAIGFDPPKFLLAGDVVRIEIEGIGHLENTIIDEPEATVRVG
jgi:2-keto-4-pentenoate hydratase/2-oxohepta-3-ene-1,7-dioic acid hydratase in catechol pathway